jgi:hypothetical protein
MAQQGRNGPRIGVSPLSTGNPGIGRSDGSRGYGKGRLRGDQHMTASGPAQGAPPPYGSPRGEPLAPQIGPGEPRGPADRRR